MHHYGMGSKGPSPWRKSEDFEFLKKEYLGVQTHNQEGQFTDQNQMIKENTEGRRKECTELKPEADECGEAWRKTTGWQMKDRN